MDAETVSVLKAHRARQARWRLELGPEWPDTGRVFTQPTGQWINPDWLSDYFDRLVAVSGLPRSGSTISGTEQPQWPWPLASR